MRKKMFAVAFGVALVGAAGIASAQSTQPPASRPDGRWEQKDGQGRRGPGGRDMALLHGINLSDAQKAKLADVRKKTRPSDAQREQFRTAMAKARDLRQRGDTAAAEAQMRDVRVQMQHEREQRFSQIRSILTEDQRKQFDTNLAELKQREAQHRGSERGREHGQHAPNSSGA